MQKLQSITGHDQVELGLKKVPSITITINNSNLNSSLNGAGFAGYRYAPTRTHGSFMEWDIGSQEATIKRDRLGLMPIYYATTEDSLFISGSILDIAKKLKIKNIDESAVAAFMRFGSYIGNTTCFHEIKYLRGNEQINVNHSGISITQHQDEHPPIKFQGTKDEAIEIYAELFARAVRKFTAIENIKSGITLSGGRDSRHIFLALAEEKKPVEAITATQLPPKSSEDATVASLLTEEIGVPHHIVEQPKHYLQNELEKNRIVGFNGGESGWSIPLINTIKQGNYDAMYDGIAGDILSQGLFLTKSRLKLATERNFDALAEDILTTEGYLPQLLTEKAYKRFSRDKALSLVRELLREVENNPNPVSAFYFNTPTLRYISQAGTEILGKDRYLFRPYVDPDVYNFLVTLPTEFFIDHTFHTETILKRYPQYAHIRFEIKGNLKGLKTHFMVLIKAGEFCYYVLSKKSNRSILRMKFMFKRMLASTILPDFAVQFANAMALPVYLTQLNEEACPFSENR